MKQKHIFAFMNFSKYIPYYKRNLHLALPIVLSQVGQVAVQLFDNMMVGHVGTTELAAASFASNVFMIAMYFGMGITYGMTPLVGEAYGKKQLKKVGLILKNNFTTHFFFTLSVMSLMLIVYFLLPFMGQEEDVIKLAKPYYLLLVASYLPFMIFFTFKQFFEGIGNTKIAMIITLSANIINIALNYVLIYGQLGFPALGLNGAGLATLIARLLMPSLFVVFILNKSRFKRYFLLAYYQPIIKSRIKQALKVGIPISLQLIVEVSAFGIAAVMMGWLGEVPLAAHQVVIGLVSLTYMVCLGVSQATTIRVSHQVGKKNYHALKMAAYASTHLVVFFMACMAISMFVFRGYLPFIFTEDLAVVQVAANLLIIAALFQIVDGLGIVMLGILRGLADVKYPMYFTFIAYLLIGIPISYLTAFVFDAGANGIWWGFYVGVGVSALLFYIRFRMKIKRREAV